MPGAILNPWLALSHLTFTIAPWEVPLICIFRKLGFRKVMRFALGHIAGSGRGCSSSDTETRTFPGPTLPREQHLAPVAPSSLMQQTSPGLCGHISHALVPLLTLWPRRHPHSNVGSWHPGQATHTSHRPCGPGSDTSSTGHGVPSPAGSSLEWAPAGTGHSTCSHTGDTTPSTCEHLWSTYSAPGPR